MSAPHHSRRNFLRGQAAAKELASLTDTVADIGALSPEERRGQPASLMPRNSGPSGRDAFLVSVRRRAMACDFEVQLAASRDDASMEHVFAALDLVESLERQLTIYRDDSELMSINRLAASRPVVAESRLFGLLQRAERLYRDTNGALDITSGPLSDAWGFSRREGRLPTDQAITDALLLVGMDHVHLDATRGTVTFDRPGVYLNLNSMGKGYALDRMAEVFACQLVDDYLAHGGKSSVLARGNQPGNAATGGWTVGLRHPLRPAERMAEFVLRDQALSTSGSGTQFFIRRGKRYGHILDPRTGRPAEGLFSATVIAGSAAEAEGLSTAFYVMGPELAADYCATHPEIAAVLVAPAERDSDVRVIAFGMGERQWRSFI